MKQYIGKFILRLTILTIIITITGWIFFTFIFKDHYLPVFPFTLLLFFIVTGLIHIYQVRLANKNIARFTRSNMLATTLKLFIYSVFAIAYLAVNPARAITFVIVLFILYLIFNTFEVIELSNYNRRLNK